MQIHEKIKLERIKAGLNPGQLAAKLGIPRTTYLYWEEKTPEVDKIRAVAKALGKPDNYFFDKTADNFDSTVNEDNVTYEVKGTLYKGKDMFLTLLEEKDLAIKRAEEGILKAEEVAKKMEAHYEDAKADKEKLFIALNKLQETFDETLKQISDNLKAAAASLAHNQQDLALLKDQTYIVSDQLEQQRVGLGIGLPGEKPHPVPFVKKGKAGSGTLHDGGKKSKGHSS
jgi:transcriptional regulator with XRE-family HTH domain